MRFAAPNATIMLHEAAMWAAGKTADLKADVNELERLEKIIFGLLDEKSGKRAGHYQRLLKKAQRVDLFLSPKEAKANGLIDHVGVPSLTIDVTCKVQLVATGEVVK
jgi:ATP-dependent protease ClpP protease subunit